MRVAKCPPVTDRLYQQSQLRRGNICTLMLESYLVIAARRVEQATKLHRHVAPRLPASKDIIRLGVRCEHWRSGILRGMRSMLSVHPEREPVYVWISLHMGVRSYSIQIIFIPNRVLYNIRKGCCTTRRSMNRPS